MLEVLAFLFLCWVGFIVLGIVIVFSTPLGDYSLLPVIFPGFTSEGQLIFNRPADRFPHKVFQIYTNAGGHCEFSNSELAAVFEALPGEFEACISARNAPRQL